MFLDQSHFLQGVALPRAAVVCTLQAYLSRFGCEQSCANAASLVLTGTRVAHDLQIADSKFEGNVQADYLVIDGSLTLRRPAFGAVADFASGTVGKFLKLGLPSWPARLSISALRYGSISNGRDPYDAPSSWRDLKRLLATCDCGADVYTHVEEFFRDSGETSLADEVYVQRKIQERTKLDLPGDVVDLLAFGIIGDGVIRPGPSI